MRWKGRRQSNNVRDVRGQSSRGSNPFGRSGMGFPSGRRGIPIGRGGFSIKTIMVLIVVGVVLQFMGVDVLSLISGQQGGSVSQTTTNQSMTAKEREQGQFVATILAETEDVWNGIFESSGERYEEPKLTLFSGAYPSACGQASAATGPFYCPSDRMVYLDTAFFTEMQNRLGAGGDFAFAYVIAHEVGHHIQNLTGVLPEFNRARRTMSKVEANAMSVRVELQADCYAGVWGHFTRQKGLLESGDLEEAMNAAHQIGDDALQKSAQGYAVPDSFTHGTSAQRMKWFKRGFDSGRAADCDTFSGEI